ncbi:MAG: hypothetical protein K8Q99_08075 [Acholeplasmataceae bacterium]|nr:hypothetical protein [Acholeplasmataceae bacterium]
MKRILLRKKSIITILLVILVISNFTITFAYWASNVSGPMSQNNSTVSIGNWTFVPPGSTVLTEEVSIDLLNGDLPLDGDYVLVGDLDLSGYADNEFDPITNFTGTFEGNGYTIGGFSINNENTTPGTELGMFINTGTESVISNVNVSNVTVTQSDLSGGNNTNETTYVGVLVGANNGTISNVQVIGSEISGGNTVNGIFGSSTLALYAGGLVGRNNGVIINSYARVNVTLNSTISASWFGSSTSNVYVGGLVGYNAGTISKSYATGNVTNNMTASTSGWGASNTINSHIGGLVGLNTSGASVSLVFATGNITYTGTSTGTRYIGLVVGRNLGSTSTLYRRTGQTITSPTYTQNTANTTSTSITNLQSQTFLTNTLGFDFINVWESVVGDYPIIQD